MPRLSNHRFAVVALGLLAAAGQAHAVLSFAPFALSGRNDALGPNAGADVFTNLGNASPSINSSGTILFRGDSTTFSSANGSGGLWSRSGGINTNFAGVGGAAPGGGTYGLTGFNFPSITDSGQFVFRDSSGATAGLYSGGAAPVARSTTLAPGAGGATFATISNAGPYITDSGTVVYGGTLTGTGVVTTAGIANTSGIWSGTPSGSTLHVRQNDPTGIANVNVGAIAAATNGAIALNASTGGFFFSSTLQSSVAGAVVTTGALRNDSALYSYTPGEPTPLNVIARRGSAAPGTTSDFYNFSSGVSIAANSSGRVGFASALRDSAGVSTATIAIFSDNAGGGVDIKLRTGQALPVSITGATTGEFTGVNWGTGVSRIVMNSAGTIGFSMSGMTGTGITAGQNSDGIFRLDAAGQFAKVMRTGDAAPGVSTLAGDTVRFGSVQSGFLLNSLNQMVFSNTLRSDLGGVNGVIGNNNGLFAADGDGSIFLIAQRQTAFTFTLPDNTVVSRIVSSIGGVGESGGQDGRVTQLSDSGLLTFSLSFTDGTSGVFTTLIPSPASATLLALGGLLAARRRR